MSKTLQETLGTIESLQALQAKVRELAEADPDYIYGDINKEGCMYRPDPLHPHGCIIGYAVRELGCTKLDEIEPGDQISIGFLVRQAWGVDRRGALPNEANLISDWLDYVQDYQDEGQSWGEALRLADSVDEELEELEEHAWETDGYY